MVSISAIGAKTGKKSPASRPSLASTLFLRAQTFNSLFLFAEKRYAEVKIQQAGDKARGHLSNSVSKMMH